MVKSNVELAWETMEDTFLEIQNKFHQIYKPIDTGKPDEDDETTKKESLDITDDSTLSVSPITQLLYLARLKFYDLTPLDNQKSPFPFKNLRGKVVLIVNVASRCGFSFQYNGLEQLNKRFANDDFVLLGIPCNQFLWQEPGTNDQIVTKCKKKYDVSFQILDKINVNGEQADPVYKFLKAQKEGLWGTNRVKWNFEKFLIDKNGRVVERYSTFTRPVAITPRIEQLLES